MDASRLGRDVRRVRMTDFLASSTQVVLLPPLDFSQDEEEMKRKDEEKGNEERREKERDEERTEKKEVNDINSSFLFLPPLLFLLSHFQIKSEIK